MLEYHKIELIEKFINKNKLTKTDIRKYLEINRNKHIKKIKVKDKWMYYYLTSNNEDNDLCNEMIEIYNDNTLNDEEKKNKIKYLHKNYSPKKKYTLEEKKALLREYLKLYGKPTYRTNYKGLHVGYFYRKFKNEI